MVQYHLGNVFSRQKSHWANGLLGNYLLGKCLSGQMLFWSNVLLGKCLMGKCLNGQMALWAKPSGSCQDFWVVKLVNSS
jgi:hypothetical protein